RDTTNPKNITHTAISRTDSRIFKKQKERLTDMLTSRFSEKSREGEETASRLSPLRSLEVAKRREEETRYGDVTHLVGLVQSRPFFPKIRPSIRDIAL
ncbi:MAG: hypothetical protein PV344_02930, partial [Anaplasma sp.]|nr:hypothetical protein [Anaplasma sp.]